MRIMVAGWCLKENEYDDYAEVMMALGAEESFVSLDINELDHVDGLVFPGSVQDIDPARFGQENQGSKNVCVEHDDTDWKLMDRALELGIPVLGICRGAQFINVYFGGDLTQDLCSWAVHKYREPEAYHEVITVPGSFLSKFFGPVASVNSRHHQGLGGLGKGLKAIALWTKDLSEGLTEADVAPEAAEGLKNRDEWEYIVAEAVQHESLPVIGYQWHPEKMVLHGKEQQKEDGAAAIRYFLDICRTRTEQKK